MAKNRLLDRQVSLLNYLTSAAAIFGDRSGAVVDRALRGIDPGLLHLEAYFSYQKRMEKIVVIFAITFELLGKEKNSLLRAFVEQCPPADIGHLTNARQFHDFLLARWRRRPPRPAYVRDVAACELACATARAHVGDTGPETANGKRSNPRPGIRRAPGVVLLRCAYDVRPIFEAVPGRAVPARRNTPLAVTVPPGATQPQVFELPAALFDLVSALDHWTDPAALSGTIEFDLHIRELADHGLLEVRR
jgi:hypothetical protein